MLRQNAWGFNLHTGQLRRASKGQGYPGWQRGLPPDGYPDGDRAKVMTGDDDDDDDDDTPRLFAGNLRGRSIGAEITVVVDHDAGILGFRIKGVNNGELLHAVSGFPRGAALRPHASLFFCAKDRVSFVRGFVTPSAAGVAPCC